MHFVRTSVSGNSDVTKTIMDLHKMEFSCLQMIFLALVHPTHLTDEVSSSP